ncbi:MAG: hypothetical protein WAM07_05815 [Halobacillus sp.]|uniref:hypothetical protein n=1 Tax=Halobacillus sp. TaxID=56800 RepID=UPI003BB13245
MAKKIIIITGILFTIILSLVYIDQRYFFNPVKFSQDAVTPHDWNEYERPMTLTYYKLEDGRQTVTIDTEQEIKTLLRTLKESPHEEDAELSEDVEGAIKLSSNKHTLLEIYFYADHWKILKEKGAIYEITQPLEQLFNKY